MNIGIITHPLESNYGGILQNYALQHILIKLGHNPITIDYHPNMPMDDILRYNLKTLYLLLFRREKRPFRVNVETSALLAPFIFKHINLTERYTKLCRKMIKTSTLSAVIVGSDQVWSVKYGKRLRLEDMFLKFLKHDSSIIKIAYAASFGTDEWNLTSDKTSKLKSLVKRFDAISVREASGVDICKKQFEYESVHLLDPTLLLKEEDYNALIETPESAEKYILAYILDSSEQRLMAIDDFSHRYNMPVRIISAHDNATKTVEEWLSMFRDASYVVTDSFHGLMFSIIYEKSFSCFVNAERGADRFMSILSQMHLENRIINDDIIDEITEIDWSRINHILNEKREESMNFLRRNLKSKVNRS